MKRWSLTAIGIFVVAVLSVPLIGAADRPGSPETILPSNGLVIAPREASDPASGELLQYELLFPTLLASGCMGEGEGPIQCLCPIQAQPVLGTFSLQLISEDHEVTEYALVGLDWKLGIFVGEGAEPLDEPITGTGVYRIVDDTLHQLVLDLDVNGIPGHYDSGVVEGADFPTIEITASMNQFVGCFDEAFSIIAEPLPTPADAGH